MRRVSWFLFGVLLVLFAASAMAGSLPLTYTPPTLNTDGSTIPATGAGSITKYSAYYGICVSGNLPASPLKVDIPAPAVAYTIDNVAPGNWCIRMSVTNTYNNESALRNVATKTVVPPTPLPPSGLQVASNEIFQIIGTKDRVAFLPVGTVPGGTLCDETQPMGDKFVVPLSDVSVTWYGRTKPQVVVAKCS